MNIYTKMLEFFMENDYKLSKDQMQSLQEYCEDIEFEVLQEETKDHVEKRFLKYYTKAVQHIVKYVYNPDVQSTSWVGTIRQQTKFMSDIYNDKSLWNKISNDITDEKMEEIYKQAVAKAKKEGNNCDYPEDMPKIVNAYELMDGDVEDLLHKYEESDSVKRSLYGEKKKNKKKRK